MLIHPLLMSTSAYHEQSFFPLYLTQAIGTKWLLSQCFNLDNPQLRLIIRKYKLDAKLIKSPNTDTKLGTGSREC